MKRVIVTILAAALLIAPALSQDFGFGAAPGGPGGPALAGMMSSGMTNRGATGAGVNSGLFADLGNGAFSGVDVAAGDFNGDGIGDVAVAQGGGEGRLTIFTGEGNGTFGLPVSVGIMNQPVSIATGDLDLDGLSDIAITGVDFPSDVSGQLEVHSGANLSEGTPNPNPTLWLDGPPTSISIGQLDVDSLPDLAVGFGYDDGSGGIQTMMDFQGSLPKPGDPGPPGSMSFSNGGKRFMETLPTDVNIVGGNVAVGTGQGLSVFRPTAEGFATVFSQNLPTFNGGTEVAVGDFNADGVADLFTLNGMTPPATASATPNLFLSAQGTIGDPTSLPGVALPDWASPTDMTVGDFNLDGFPDIAVAISNGGFGTPGAPGVTIIQNDGKAGFTVGQTYPMTSWPNFLTAGSDLSYNTAGNAAPTLNVINFCKQNAAACGGNGLSLPRTQAGVSAGTTGKMPAQTQGRGNQGARRFDTVRELGRYLAGLLTVGAPRTSAARLAGFGQLGQPPVRAQVQPAQVIFTATGASSGDFFQMEIIDRSGRAQRGMVPDGIVLEPIADAPTPPSPGAGVSQQDMAGFCVDVAKEVPAPGTHYRIASPAAQKQAAPLRNVLAASKQLALRGLLHSDGSKGYINFVRQYAVWAKRENWDLKKFGESFVQKTKQNVLSMKGNWTDVMEQGVRAAIPGRWRDIEEVLKLSNQIATPSR